MIAPLDLARTDDFASGDTFGNFKDLDGLLHISEIFLKVDALKRCFFSWHSETFLQLGDVEDVVDC